MHDSKVFAYFVVLLFRLAGYENSLLGYKPRIYSTIKSLLKEDKNAIDVLMFGKKIIVCSSIKLLS